MKQRKTPRPRTRPPLPPTASQRDALADDSLPATLTVHDPQDAFFIIKSIGSILSGYKPDDDYMEGVQGVGFALERLAEAGEKSLARGKGGEV